MYLLLPSIEFFIKVLQTSVEKLHAVKKINVEWCVFIISIELEKELKN